MPASSFSIRGMGKRQVINVKASSALSFMRHSHDEYGTKGIGADRRPIWTSGSGRAALRSGRSKGWSRALRDCRMIWKPDSGTASTDIFAPSVNMMRDTEW